MTLPPGRTASRRPTNHGQWHEQCSGLGKGYSSCRNGPEGPGPPRGTAKWPSLDQEVRAKVLAPGRGVSGDGTIDQGLMLRNVRAVAAALEPREWLCKVRAAAADPNGRLGADAAAGIPACPLGWPPGVRVAVENDGATPREAGGRPCPGRPPDHWHCYCEKQLRPLKSESHSRYSDQSKSAS